MPRTTADIQLGQVLGNLASSYNSQKPDAYRTGVQMRLNENADQRNAQTTASQLETEALKREELRMKLEDAKRGRSLTPQDIIQQLGGFGPGQAEELDMALNNPDFQPTTVNQQDIRDARSAMRTKGAYDLGGPSVDQIIKAMGAGQDQEWSGAVRENIDPRNLDQVGRAEAALAGKGYDPSPGGASGQRDAAVVNTLKYYMAPPPNGLGMSQDAAFARLDKASQQRIKELYALQRANLSSFGDPADLGNIDQEIQDVLNPPSTPPTPDVLDMLQRLNPAGAPAMPGPAAGGYNFPAGGGNVVKRYQ